MSSSHEDRGETGPPDSPDSPEAISSWGREWSVEHTDDGDDNTGGEGDNPHHAETEDSDDGLDERARLERLLEIIDAQVEFSIQGPASDNPESESDSDEESVEPMQPFTTRQILSMLPGRVLRHYLHHNDEETTMAALRRRQRRRAPPEYPKVPSEAGRELMASGDFGANPYFVDQSTKRNQKLFSRLLWREMDQGQRGMRAMAPRTISQGLIPGAVTEKIIHYDHRCYSGQFSDDGNFFFCCSQDFKVRMYDTANPYDWKYYKMVDYPYPRWTITDASLSPDNRFLAYSSIEPTVCLAATDPSSDSDPIPLNFSRGRRRAHLGGYFGSSHFGIWSIRFSGDGREIVAGTAENSVIVYDIESHTPILRLQNHDDDVNAVCYGDKSSPHILYSGSDDTTLRVWDRRSMADGREAGAFVGHTEGLTYVDSKGDGRYVLSNGKDQTMKLWDLRKMMTTAKFDHISNSRVGTGFDYRYMSYPDDVYEPHPDDCSVVTFRGHSVLRTLIRCHFSPPNSTNSRYVYSGSQDGKVYVYNLDATIAGVIDVTKASINSRPRSREMFANAYGMKLGDGVDWKTCVRDASWHPSAPLIAATAWNGWDMSTGTCTVHSWNDNAEDDEADPPLGKSYDCELHYEESFNRHRERLVTMGLVDQSQTPSAQSPSATVRARRGAQVW